MGSTSILLPPAPRPRRTWSSRTPAPGWVSRIRRRACTRSTTGAVIQAGESGRSWLTAALRSADHPHEVVRLQPAPARVVVVVSIETGPFPQIVPGGEDQE